MQPRIQSNLICIIVYNMPKFKIASWNVNSIRVRLPQVTAWLAEVEPDVLALQETKTEDDKFPLTEIHELGYNVCFSGQKAYNGVAVLSKNASRDVCKELPGIIDPQKRVLGCALDEMQFLNLYVPNGEHITSKKYEYKLNWLKQLQLYIEESIKLSPNMVIVGDFNIAPHDMDVYDPTKWMNQVLCTDAERQAFRDILSLGFTDAFRHLSESQQQYTWWDYRMNAFKRNLGLRIDHILVSHKLIAKCTKCYVDQHPRGWERPSDHAPIVAEFDL